MVVLIEDTRQKAEKHAKKHETWRDDGDTVIRCKLPYGDYIQAPEISVDTKQDLQEIATNMCGAPREKKRFREECKLAQDAGAVLVFLIEDERIGDISDLYGRSIWIPPGKTIPGDQLAQAMHTMSQRYGCRFVFCHPKDAGKRVKEILELTGVKEIDDLIRVMNNKATPAWKRDVARHKFLKIKERHDRIAQMIEDSEEYPCDAIRRFIKGEEI